MHKDQPRTAAKMLIEQTIFEQRGKTVGAKMVVSASVIFLVIVFDYGTFFDIVNGWNLF